MAGATTDQPSQGRRWTGTAEPEQPGGRQWGVLLPCRSRRRPEGRPLYRRELRAVAQEAGPSGPPHLQEIDIHEKSLQLWLFGLGASRPGPAALAARTTRAAIGQEDNTAYGTTSAEFLLLGAGARGAALGGAFAAIATDVSALYYNPAGAALMSRRGYGRDL